MKYRKKQIDIEASRWFQNGDHPEDHSTEGREGMVVRYFRDPERSSTDKCRYCNLSLFAHGWINTLEGGHIVCPGDWIITGINGEYYPCKHDIFLKTYVKI